MSGLTSYFTASLEKFVLVKVVNKPSFIYPNVHHRVHKPLPLDPKSLDSVNIFTLHLCNPFECYVAELTTVSFALSVCVSPHV
jgi:hypothetical protein